MILENIFEVIFAKSRMFFKSAKDFRVVIKLLTPAKMEIVQNLIKSPEIYIQSAPNNLNESHTFMCLVRAGRFGQH